MKNNGKGDYWIKFVRKALSHLKKNADLNRPEQVKQFIASKNVTNGYKKNLALAYNLFCKYYKIDWEMPKYKVQSRTIRIPTTEKLNMLIARAGKTLGLKLTISKETGLRPIELCNLRVKDIDFDKRRIHPTTAKNGASRILRMSTKLSARLQALIEAKTLDLNAKIFNGNAEAYSKAFRQMRNLLANKIEDQTLKTIRLYDLRHYFATMLYAKTRDMLYVKQQMGHKKIETTLIYTQLLHLEEDDNFTCKTASNVKQATELIENGFEYIQEIDGIRLYRKRK